MSLITPMTGRESVGQVRSSDGLGGSSLRRGLGISGKEETGSDFQTVLKGLYLGSTESMDSIFEEAASRYGLSVDLLKAVAKTESNFNANAVSKAGAMGVMQLMPSTAKSLGVTDPFDARQNIMGGARCLKNNLDQFNGNVSLALAAYNAGAGSVKKYGGIPPYKETQGFVKKVLGYMDGSPLYAGKTVGSSGWSGLSGSLGNSSYGSVSDLLLGMYGSSYGDGGLSGLYGGSSSSGPLSGLYGSGSSGLLSDLGSSGSIADTLGILMDASSDGSLDEEEYAGMVQVLRMQMMMNASRQLGEM